MVWFRKAMILTHRYLGIALCVPIVMWFVSGIGMMYAGGMPRLTPETRLERLPPLDLTQVRLSPSEAAEHGNMTTRPGRLVLTTIMDRPAYRFDRGTYETDGSDGRTQPFEHLSAAARTVEKAAISAISAFMGAGGTLVALR